MKKLIYSAAVATILSACGASKSPEPLGMVATVQMDEPLEGICDNNSVYHLSPIFGANQVKAVCPVSDEDLAIEMNATASLKENTTMNGEGMLGMFINCEGDLVQVKIDKSTGNETLDGELEAIVAKHDKWKAGMLNGNHVDSHTLISFEISDGILSIN